MQGFLIFTDLAKYSKLEDRDLKIYYDEIVPVIYDRLKTYKAGSLVWNTWGDAIVAAFKEGKFAIDMSLEYRDIFKSFNFEKLGMRQVVPRIAGHFGEFEVLYDKVSGKINMHGTNVNLAARIEPVTTPGEVFVSQSFKNQVMPEFNTQEFRFDDMGIVQLPKEAGEINAYRLCRAIDSTMSPVGKVVPKAGEVANPAPQRPPTPIKRSGFKR